MFQRLPERDSTARPHPLNTTQSFSRYEPSGAKTSPVKPPSILSDKSNPLSQSPLPKTPDAQPERSHSDIFDTQDESEGVPAIDGTRDDSLAEGLEVLPIEIQSLMERFLESLSLKSSNSTLSIDRLAELYQNFYMTVESHIATHIATLSSRIAREKSPTPSVSSVGSASSARGARKGTRDRPTTKRQETEQQMLTASEVSDRRKTRKQLELKKLAMEEAVERGICERVYPRLWRHTSTDDESRDAKLRSRAAALSVVGVDLKELLSTAMASEGTSAPDLSVATKSNRELVRDKLEEARVNLEQMNDDRYPQAKLQRLSTVHKNIVESLSQLFPSSSSADEILPTMIYIIIISSPETVNVVSNLLFIQRFRNQNKLDGEAAYCLTNLEAAISFLETVDLSSIRPDEPPEGPVKQASSHPSTPKNEASNPLYRGLPLSPPPQPLSPSSNSQKHSRRLSNFLSSKPSNPLEAASGVVLTGADSAFDAMHNALDGSFKFLFGRLREKQATQSPAGGPEVAAPKTLEDARKLVSQEEKGEIGDEDELSGVDPPSAGDDVKQQAKEDGNGRMLELIGGKRGTQRDQSIASTRSDGSGKKVAFANSSVEKPKSENTTTTTTTTTSPGTSGNNSATAAQSQAAGYTPLEQMRNLSNSLNPLNYKGFSMRGFGRSGTPTASPASNPSTPAPTETPAPQTDGTAQPEPNPGAEQEKKTTLDLSGIAPPIQRFVALKEAKELNGFDVELLLRDYQRLAGALKALQS